jgi:hypothetical protein
MLCGKGERERKVGDVRHAPRLPRAAVAPRGTRGGTALCCEPMKGPRPALAAGAGEYRATVVAGWLSGWQCCWLSSHCWLVELPAKINALKKDAK